MVYPVFSAHTFAVGTKGLDSTEQDMKPVSNLESFSVSFDNGIEEWHPFESQGWVRRMMTAKSLAITLNGKRDYGDAGNDYLAGLMLKTGNDATTKFKWTMQDGATVTFDCVVNVTSVGGDSTAVDALEIEVQSDGFVQYTPAG